MPFPAKNLELVELHNFADQQQAAAAIFEYIEVFYNKIRLHSTIGYLAPTQFEDNERVLKKSVL